MLVIDDKTTFMLHKALELKIAPGLSTKEFRCKCKNTTCHYTLISPRLVNAWTIVRLKFGHELKVNSGFRCQKHNEAVGGILNSKHTIGEAVDISTEGFKPLQIRYLKDLLNRNFDTVIEYPNFYHCHNN